MNKLEADKLVKKKLPEKRYLHSVRVAETAVKMADIFNADKDQCELAGILHDYCKYDALKDMYEIVRKNDLDPKLLEFNQEILHGPVAAVKLKNMGIQNENILLAIEHHTSGRRHMNLLEKIIFVADYIEPKRDQPNVEEIKGIVFQQKNLDLAIYEITKSTLLYLISNDKPIYYKTFECLNYYNFTKE